MDSEKNRRSVVSLVVALTSCVVLAAAVTYLELKRDVQIDAIVRTVNFLEREVERLKRDLGAVREELVQERNQTSSLRDLVKSLDPVKTVVEEGDYYDSTFDDEYDDGDEVPEKGNGKNVAGSNNRQQQRRRRRAIGGDVAPIPPVVNAVLSQTYKRPGNRTKAGPDALIIVDPVRYYATKPEEETIEPPTFRRPTAGESCCQTVAAHYGGDITAVRHSKPSHYAGMGNNDSNHRMYHPEGVLREWKQAEWMSELGVESSFSMNHGELTVTDSPGLYYIYAQVYYADARDALGYKVLVNGLPIAQCTVTSPHSRHSGEIKANSCFTGGLVNLHRGDRLSIVEVEGYRYTLVESSRTFFGLFRVSSTRS